MRMRKKKHGDERLALCAELLTEKPVVDGNMPVFLEIGAGKGGFACGMTEKNPTVMYYAMEKVTDCVVIAAEKAKAVGRTNLKFINDTADNLMKLFPKTSIDAIFLNFSDPWSKKGYAKRRLMHRRYLSVYFNLLKDGGVLTFKTDNTGLFDFALEELESFGMTPDALTRDLHASEWQEGNVVTEYEANFVSQGMKINMLRVVKPQGFMPEVPDELRADTKRISGH